MRLIDEPGRAEIGEGRMLKTAGYTFAVCAIGTLAIAWSHTHRTPQTIQGPGDDFSRSHHGWPWPPFGVEVQRHVIRFYRRQLIISSCDRIGAAEGSGPLEQHAPGGGFRPAHFCVSNCNDYPPRQIEKRSPGSIVGHF